MTFAVLVSQVGEKRERVKDLKIYYIKSVARTLFPAMPAGRRL